MTNDYTSEAATVATAIAAVYENKQANKKDDISGDFSSDTVSYPTVKAVKGELANKLDKTHTSYKGKNVVTNSSTGVIEFEEKNNHSHGNLTSDGKVGSNANYFVYTTTGGAVTSKQKIGNITTDGKIGSTSGKPIITTTGGTVTTGDFGTSAGQFAEGNHTHSGYITSHQSLEGTVVTVEQQSTAESGYASTYVIKQGGSQVGVKINIPKDQFVQSASVATVGSTPTSAETSAGLSAGDKYIKLVVNTTNSESGATILRIPIADLGGQTYTADNSTLQMTNNQFSIKNGGVGSDQIASAVKSSWLSTSDVQTEIGLFATALANAINPSS